MPQNRCSPLFSALLVGALGLAACGGESTSSDAVAAAQAAPAAQAPAKASRGAAGCFARAIEKPCEVLTESVVHAALRSVTQTLTQSSDNIGGASCTYTWPGGRKTTIKAGQLTMDVDVDDSVRLSNVRRFESDATGFFTRSHRTPDAEQKARAVASANAEIDKKIAAGEISSEHESLGKDFAAGMLNKIDGTAVDGLGDAAAWGGVGRFKTLDVLVGDVQFSVLADSSNEEDGRREASAAVARALLEHCD